MSARWGPQSPRQEPAGLQGRHQRRVRRWVLVGLVGLALALRVYGFWWGNPYSLHNDEAFVLAHVVVLLQNVQAGGLPDPELMIYGVWPFYQMALAHTGLRALATVLALWTGVDLPTPLLYVGRLISAAYGTLGVVALYLLGRRMFTPQVGLWAAAFWAVMPLSVRNSHFATVDIQFATWLVITFLALWNVATRARPRDYVVAGAVLGLTMAVRMNAAPLLFTLLVAHGMFHWQRMDPPPHKIGYQGVMLWGRRVFRSPWLYVAAGGAVLLWAVLSVPVLDDLPDYLAGDTNSDPVVQGMVARGVIRPLYTIQFELTRPYLYHLLHLFPLAMGWPLALLAYVGWGYSLWRAVQGDKRDVLLATWTVLYFLFVGSWYVKFIRYIIPLLPFMALYAGRLTAEAGKWGYRWRSASGVGRWGVLGLRAWGVIALVYGLLFSLAYLHIYARPDTRLQALAWIKENIPPGSTIMMEFDASAKFAMRPEQFGLTMYTLRVLDHYAPNGRRGILWQAPDISPEEKWAYMMQVLDNADYVVITEAWAEVFPKLAHRFPAEARFYTQLFAGELGYRLVAMFQECPRLGPWRFCDEWAELSWRYFDHPRVYIFARQAEKGSQQGGQ